MLQSVGNCVISINEQHPSPWWLSILSSSMFGISWSRQQKNALAILGFLKTNHIKSYNSYKMTVKLPETDQNLFESSSVSSQAIRLDITTGHTSPSIPSPPGALPAKRVRKCAVGPPMSPPCYVALILRSPSTGNPRPALTPASDAVRGGWGLGGCGVGGWGLGLGVLKRKKWRYPKIILRFLLMILADYRKTNGGIWGQLMFEKM